MFLTPVLKLMAEKQASDLFISAGTPICIKILGTIMPVNQDVMDGPTVKKIAYELMSEAEQQEYERTWEMNLSFPVPDVGRFRVNVFRQRGNVALVIRYLRSQTPGLEALRLPSVLKELIMEKRGLVLVVGATGSGKSTTLAAMIEFRNATRGGHVLTIEDPIEFVFKHQRCVINQREVGLDTKSYNNALINAMREAPDILMIGEVRDRETLQQALLYRADRPPVHLDAAREQQLPRAQPHHQFLPVRRASRAAQRPRGVSESGHLPAPGQGRRRQPGRRRGSAAQQQAHPGADRERRDGSDQGSHREELVAGLGELRAGAVQALCRGQDHQGRGAAQFRLGHEPGLAHEQRGEAHGGRDRGGTSDHHEEGP